MEPNVITLFFILSALVGVDLRREFYNQMVEENHLPDIVTHNTLLGALCKEGMVNEAVQLLQLCGTSFAPSLISYNILIDGFAKTGDMKKAMSIYDEMMGNGIKADDITHRSLFWGFFRANLLEEAVDILKGDGGKKPDGMTYSPVMDSIAEAGMKEAADELRGELIERNVLTEKILLNEQ
ncbi:pentatricopeptide repeat-containing protein At1g08610-like [Punica granatum]|uniref:Pentatricopeptide repeat-containing protein At1g08610-like n=1 Tax=Punica granatum TaxID=22663 RepID=A0A6P8EB98_PUNGR|nr:pentatricopeptide repeat-containing protein At1g08610-like [Punica granatum]